MKINSINTIRFYGRKKEQKLPEQQFKTREVKKTSLESLHDSANYWLAEKLFREVFAEYLQF